MGSSTHFACIKLAEALLETAGLAHGDARRLTETSARYFAAATDEISGSSPLVDSLLRDPASTASTPRRPPARP